MTYHSTGMEQFTSENVAENKELRTNIFLKPEFNMNLMEDAELHLLRIQSQL